ncbi:hypothetical protein KY289_018384 [Solanum tuberosum]|uniref:uncharacterized protein LOC125857677 n=1 Tax=Solanum stenotomum TaxID=172797 RepID=UPI001B857E78|nr:uncharacterized protein LOC125857677 [Solanum stenotomum]KAH0691026.1 hypothetical protein KY289_018384 [Solanum tuberosum]
MDKGVFSDLLHVPMDVILSDKEKKELELRKFERVKIEADQLREREKIRADRSRERQNKISEDDLLDVPMDMILSNKEKKELELRKLEREKIEAEQLLEREKIRAKRSRERQKKISDERSRNPKMLH